MQNNEGTERKAEMMKKLIHPASITTNPDVEASKVLVSPEMEIKIA